MQELLNYSMQELSIYSSKPVINDCILMNFKGGLMIDWSCLRDDLIVQFNSMFFWIALILLISLFLRIFWVHHWSKHIKHQKWNDFITGFVIAAVDGLTVILCVCIIYYGGMFLFGS
jgi:hypothetical protein